MVPGPRILWAGQGFDSPGDWPPPGLRNGRARWKEGTLTVHLVRVDSTWHVFADRDAAYTFYRYWGELRDAECVLEQHVDTGTVTEIRELWEIPA